MDHYDEKDMRATKGKRGMGFVSGMLIGGLAGATTALLLAPRSGQETREQISRKGMELRDKAQVTMEDTMDQARAGGQRLSDAAHKQVDKIQHKAEKMQQEGKDMIEEQKDRWTPVVEAGQKAVQGKTGPGKI